MPSGWDSGPRSFGPGRVSSRNKGRDEPRPRLDSERLLDSLLDFERVENDPSLDYVPFKEGVNVLLSNTLKRSSANRERSYSDYEEEMRDDDDDDNEDSDRSFDRELYPNRRRPVTPRWSNWIKFEEPYKFFSDGSGGYALFNRSKGEIVALERVRFASEPDGHYMSIRSESNPFYVSSKPPAPSKTKATKFFRLFSGHCDKVDASFVRK